MRTSAKLGTPTATALVVGNMIGSGIFLLPASLAAFGGISMVAWLFTAAGSFLLALVFANLGRAYPRTGGPYEYSRRAFGDFVGFQTAWGYWIAAWVGNAAIAVAFVGYLGHFYDVFGSDGSKVWQAVAAGGAIWLLTWVNTLGVRQAGSVQAVTTVLKVLPLVAVALLGLFWFDAGNFPAVNATTDGSSTFGALTGAATLTLWAFIGLESATVPAEDVEHPARAIPRATLWGTAATALVYVLGTLAVMGAVPADVLAGSTAPFADAATAMWGSVWGDLVAVGAIVATFGCLNGWILVQGQVPFAAARDRLFPARFAERNRHGVPAFGLVVSSVLITLLMLTNYNASLVSRFTDMILLATLATLIPYAYTAGAELLLLATDRASFPTRRIALDATVGLVAFGYAVWTIVGAGYQAVTWGLTLLLAGIPVHVWIRWRATLPGRIELNTTDTERELVSR